MIFSITSPRAAHQPAFPQATPSIDEDSLGCTCKKTVALIIATDDGTTPLAVQSDDPKAEPHVCEDPDGRAVARPLQRYEGIPALEHALRCAADARFAAIFVLAPARAQERSAIAAAVDAARTRAPRADDVPPVTVFSLHDDLARAALDAFAAPASYELFDLPTPVLACALGCLGRHPEADSIMILPCDEVRLRPRHLRALCSRLATHPEAHVVTSWITWARRLPMLVPREFLERLSRGEVVPHASTASRGHIASLDVQEVVFGEEHLEANATMPPAFAQFLKGLRLTALEAVRLARKPADPDDADARLAEAGRSSSDVALLRVAKETLALLDEAARARGKAAAEELAAADAWGARNKADFPLLNSRAHDGRLVYLDSAATTQRLAQAMEAQRAFDAYENANVYRGAYELSQKATLHLNDARKVLEDFIGAQRRQTVYTTNATASCNLVAQAWGSRHVGEGDLVVTTVAEHHSNILPWMMLAERTGARLAYVPVRPDGRLDMDAYRALLAEGPKLVCAAHVSNVLGIVNPVREMAKLAHEAGARMLVDAAQSFAHLPLDVSELGADFVAFSGHKCYGPLGIGGLWIAPEAFAEMDPVSGGGGTVSHVALDSYYLRAGAIQYELGTPPISQAMGLAAALRHLGELRMDVVARHSRALTAYLADGLDALGCVTVWGDHASPDGQAGLVSFSLHGVEPALAGAALGKLGVAVRSGGHCAIPLAALMGVTGTTRASIGIHTTKEDIEALLCAVRLCSDLCRRSYE